MGSAFHGDAGSTMLHGKREGNSICIACCIITAFTKQLLNFSTKFQSDVVGFVVRRPRYMIKEFGTITFRVYCTFINLTSAFRHSESKVAARVRL